MKEFRDMGSNHLTALKDQYYDQVYRIVSTRYEYMCVPVVERQSKENQYLYFGMSHDRQARHGQKKKNSVGSYGKLYVSIDLWENGLVVVIKTD